MERHGQNFNPGTTNLCGGVCEGVPSHILAYQSPFSHPHPNTHTHIEHIAILSNPRKGSMFRNGKCQHLLFGWQMSPLPSWPPSLACILVERVQISTTHRDAWRCTGNWVSPASLCTLTSKSLTEVRDRCTIVSRLPSWPVGGPLQFVRMEHHTVLTVCSSPLGSTWPSLRDGSVFNAWGLLAHLGFPPIPLDLLQHDLTQLLVLRHPVGGLECHKWCRLV